MGLRPTQGDEKRLGPATTLYGTVALSFVIPSVPGFPTSPLSLETTYVVLPKENHMQLTEAATLDRKSGGAEGSAVLRTLPGYVFRQSVA
jgi:hypothetical protein